MNESDAVHFEQNGLKTLVESLVFVADGPVPIQSIAKALEQDDSMIERALDELEEDYRARGFRLQRTRERVQLVSAPQFAFYIQKFLGLESSARLSAPALETLAIIAYRQPITRPQIEAVRGVNCDAVIHNLLARGLVEQVGRLETVGHPIQYATTFDFLQYFGLNSVDDLPPLPADLDQSTTGAAEFLRGRETGAQMRESEKGANVESTNARE